VVTLRQDPGMRLHHLALAVRDQGRSIAFNARSSVRFRGPSGSREMRFDGPRTG
jgi:hypothetical protein